MLFVYKIKIIRRLEATILFSRLKMIFSLAALVRKILFAKINNQNSSVHDSLYYPNNVVNGLPVFKLIKHSTTARCTCQFV